jgi:hypothetical protein
VSTIVDIDSFVRALKVKQDQLGDEMSSRARGASRTRFVIGTARAKV